MSLLYLLRQEPSLLMLHTQMVGRIVRGRLVEAIETFFADGGILQHNREPEIHGRAQIADLARQRLAGSTVQPRFDVVAAAVDESEAGNGVVFYELSVSWQETDTSSWRVVECVVVEYWSLGKIQSMRLYGDLRMMQRATATPATSRGSAGS